MSDKPQAVVTLDAINAAPDTKGEPVDVPEWGGRVVVRGFKRREALQWSDTEDTAEMDAIAVHYGLVEPAVTIEQAREIVASKSQVAVSRIIREVMRLSGLGANFRNQGADD